MSTRDWDDDALEEEERLRSLERELDAQKGATDYYILLNVSRKASTDDIRNAYKNLSRIFHPDKQRDQQTREWAQRQFLKIHRAYEVLVDARSREAYDQLGERGVEMSKALGFKVQSPRDLQRLFEEDVRRQRIEEVERWSRSKSVISVGLNTAMITSPNVRMFVERSGNLKQLPRERVGVGSVFMKHSFSTELTSSLSTTITGQVFDRNGRSAKNVLGTLTYSSDAIQNLSVSVPVLPPYNFTINSVHASPGGARVNTRVRQQTLDFSTPPAVDMSITRDISSTSSLILGVASGNRYTIWPLWKARPIDDGSMAKQTQNAKIKESSVSIVYRKEHGARRVFTLATSVNKDSMSLGGGYIYKFNKHFTISTDTYFTGRGGHNPKHPQHTTITAGGWTSCTVTGAINSLTKVDWDVSIGTDFGVLVTLGFTRLEHSIRVPIVLTPFLEVNVALCAIAVPVTAMLGLNYGFFQPRHSRLVQKRMDELKEEQRYQLFQQKREADETVRVIKGSVERSRKRAQATDGLFIESAHYGDLPFNITAENTNGLLAALAHSRESRTALSASDEARACDVTYALHALINDNQLVIAEGGSKRFLPGFYDPAFGVPKSLFVRYRFRGRLHEIVVKDKQALAIPMRAHCVE